MRRLKQSGRVKNRRIVQRRLAFKHNGSKYTRTDCDRTTENTGSADASNASKWRKVVHNC